MSKLIPGMIMKSLILFLLTLSLNLTTITTYNATFQLKEQYIPPNGVVIFGDIGGTLGSGEGLFCAVNDTNVPLMIKDVYWAFPDNRPIFEEPADGKFGSGTCNYMDNCTSLYYGGNPGPPERGLFHCVLEWKPQQPPQPIDNEMVPVNIVNMSNISITGPDNLVTAGDNIELSVSLSVDPDNTTIPYQWQFNGNDLNDSDTYKGTNTDRLRIINIQDNNKGKYRVSIAHSDSRYTNNLTINVVTVRAEIIPSQDEFPMLGDNFALTCNDTVIGVDQASLQSPTITYTWFKNSIKVCKEQTLTFNSLRYEDIGTYSCQVSVHSTNLSHDLNDTKSFLLTSCDVIYQLSLDIYGKCPDWIHLNTNDKVDSININIVNKINSQCDDNTTDVENGIIRERHAFRCRSEEDNHAVYNVHLRQTANANITKLVRSCMDPWIKLPKNPTILVTGAEYDINQKCSGVLVDSDTIPFICSWIPSKSLDVGAGFAIALAILFIVAVVVIVGIVTYYRRQINRRDYEQIK